MCQVCKLFINLLEVDDVMFGMEGEILLNFAALFRIAEIVTESCPQSSLGNRTDCENEF